MNRLVAIFIVAAAFAQSPDRPIRPAGTFSDMVFSNEHAGGHTVELWRDENSLIGMLLVAEGLQGDTPTGLLENVKYNSRTGALSFTAKLTTGAAMLPGGGQEPSRDLFEFKGVLSAKLLTGTFTRRDMLEPPTDPWQIRVLLKVQPGDMAISARTYGAWKNQVDRILKFRGPKW